MYFSIGDRVSFIADFLLRNARLIYTFFTAFFNAENCGLESLFFIPSLIALVLTAISSFFAVNYFLSFSILLSGLEISGLLSLQFSFSWSLTTHSKIFTTYA